MVPVQPEINPLPMVKEVFGELKMALFAPQFLALSYLLIY
jgi:hypothetical protein